MKILITGSAGFIGFHLTQRLLKEGYTVVGLDNINDYYDPNLKYARLAETGIYALEENTHTGGKNREYKQINFGEKIASITNSSYSFVRLNLEDKCAIDKLFETEKFDYAVNLAAQAGVRYSIENPDAYIQSNIVGFFNILEACRHNPVKHLVYASSSSVYGTNAKIPFSETDQVDNPVSLYAATKKSNELMAHTYSHLYKVPTTGLRFFTVYGPWGRPDMAPILFASAISSGKPINVFNNGNLERDFTYIDDIVEGITKVIFASPLATYNKEEHPRNEREVVEPVPSTQQPDIPYSIYNIGNGSPVKLLDFIKTIENELEINAEKILLPMQPGDVYKTYADVSGLKRNFSYAPNTPLSSGIKSFVEWYIGYYGGSRSSEEGRGKTGDRSWKV